MRKNLTLCLLALCCALVLAVPARAETVIGSCGEGEDDVSWELDDSGRMTISGSGRMKDFNTQEIRFGGNADQVTALVIGPGVTYIGSNAFPGSTALPASRFRAAWERTRFQAAAPLRRFRSQVQASPWAPGRLWTARPSQVSVSRTIWAGWRSGCFPAARPYPPLQFQIRS